MRKEKLKQTRQNVLEVVVLVTCCVVLITFYRNYQERKKAFEKFEITKLNIVRELELNYRQLLEMESRYWNPFYKKITDSTDQIPYKITKEKFKEITRWQFFPYNGFGYYNDAWEISKTSGFTEKLNFRQLEALRDYYKDQKELIYHYNKVIEVTEDITKNYTNTSVLESNYDRAGSWLDEIRIVNLYKQRHYNRIESAIEHLGDTINPILLEQKEKLITSKGQENKEEEEEENQHVPSK